MATNKIPASSYLRINDIEFEVPPTQITISKREFNKTFSTLRSSGATRVKSGRRSIDYSLSLYFATGSNAGRIEQKEASAWINQQLSPLLIQIRKCPFVSIENEKIRQEIFGEGSVSDKRNLAAVVKQISIRGDIRKSEFITVDLVMGFFNHYPFTPDFSYREIGNSGASLAQDVPGDLFRQYYRSGVVDDRGRLSNEIDTLSGSGLELIYKQYYEIDLVTDNLQELLDQISDSSELETQEFQDVYSTEIRVPLDPIQQKREALERLGWVFEDDFSGCNKNSKIIYRFKKFSIQETVELDSGTLIVEGANANLEIKTAEIPLQSHAVPVHQFLGCSDGRISFVIFANAEQQADPQTRESRPVGTSKKLGLLNRILEIVNQNALRFNRVSQNDSIFIRHPVSTLLKYKQYTNLTDKRYMAYDPATGETTPFDPNKYLACTVENSNSQTVPGHPYCSRFVLQMAENYRNIDSDTRFSRDGGSNRVYTATLDMLRTLTERFGISRSGDSFLRTTRPIGVSNTEARIADKFIESLNSTLEIEDFNSVNEILNNRNVIETGTRELNERILEVLPETPGIPTNSFGIATPLSYQRINELAQELVAMVARSDNAEFSDYDDSMEVFETYNLVTNDSSYPDLMLPDNFGNPDDFFFNLSEELDTPEEKQRLEEGVFNDRLEIGQQMNESFMKNETPPELREEGYAPSKWFPTPAHNILAKGGKSKGTQEETDIPFAQAPLDPTQQQVVARRGVENFDDNSYKMRRAMPTFKLYFKDELAENTGVLEVDKKGEWRNFSDFYDTNSIIDVRLAKDEENPVNVLIIRMTNTRSDIVNNFFKEDRELNSVSKEKSIRSSSVSPSQQAERLKEIQEDRLDGVILKEGTRVELRLGYEDNPNDLSIEFTGRVVNVGGNDVVEVLCQGDGVELIQELKGVGALDDNAILDSDTSQNITDLLDGSSEVQSFGSTGANTIIGEIGFLWKGWGGRSAVENIFSPSLYGTFDKVGENTISYAAWGLAAGTLTLTPAVGAAVGALAGFAVDAYTAIDTFFSGATYHIYEQSIWEILQEMTLRHPGTVCYVVPYGGRSTIFFGYPEQLYFYRPPTFAERAVAQVGRNFGVINRTRRDVAVSKFGSSNLSSLSSRAEVEQLAKENATSTEGVALESMRPFRKYHLITSEHDIVSNDMMVTSENVHNAVEVVHPKNRSDSNFDGSKGMSEYTKSDTIVADDDIVTNYIKKQTLVFHNAHQDPVEDMPERYAISALCKSLEGAYSGKITILGRPDMKPHDVVFIEDSYNDISGPVKVSKVTQIFSYQTGWITEIHPRMLVSPAGTVTLDQVSAMKFAAKRKALINLDIFYSSFIIDETDDTDKFLLARINKETGSVVRSGVSTAYDIGLTGTSVVAARRSFTGTGSQAMKAFQEAATKSGSKVGGTISGATRGAGVYVGATAKFIKVPLIGMAVDYAVSRYISWSKTRQPISFLPVHRRCKPWYTGLYGFKKNTESEAAFKLFNDAVEKTGYVVDSFKRKLFD